MRLGEVWMVNFNPTQGDEISKVRPAVIISSNSINKLRVKIVVPITDVNKPKHWHSKLIPTNENGLIKVSYADCHQIKSVSINRFTKKLGKLSEMDMSEVQITTMKVLELL